MADKSKFRKEMRKHFSDGMRVCEIGMAAMAEARRQSSIMAFMFGSCALVCLCIGLMAESWATIGLAVVLGLFAWDALGHQRWAQARFRHWTARWETWEQASRKYGKKD